MPISAIMTVLFIDLYRNLSTGAYRYWYLSEEKKLFYWEKYTKIEKIVEKMVKQIEIIFWKKFFRKDKKTNQWI